MKLSDFFTTNDVVYEFSKYDYGNCIKFLSTERGEKYVLVMKGAGTSEDDQIANLCHEMAHFVEIDDDRCTAHGWGLKYPERFVIDRTCYEPVTCNGVMREIRVLAYQKNVQRFLGCSQDIHETTIALEHLEDYIHVPILSGEAPYSEGTTHGLNYDQIKNSQFEWCKNKVDELARDPKYGIDAFISEWNRKLKIVQERFSQNV